MCLLLVVVHIWPTFSLTRSRRNPCSSDLNQVPMISYHDGLCCWLDLMPNLPSSDWFSYWWCFSLRNQSIWGFKFENIKQRSLIDGVLWTNIHNGEQIFLQWILQLRPMIPTTQSKQKVLGVGWKLRCLSFSHHHNCSVVTQTAFSACGPAEMTIWLFLLSLHHNTPQLHTVIWEEIRRLTVHCERNMASREVMGSWPNKLNQCQSIRGTFLWVVYTAACFSLCKVTNDRLLLIREHLTFAQDFHIALLSSIT